MRILYDSKDTQFKTPFGAIRENEKCVMNIMIPCACETEKVYLVIEDETGFSMKNPLVRSECDGTYEKYTADFSLFRAGLYFYSFRIVTKTTEFSIYKCGTSDTNMEYGEKWQLTCYPADFSVSKDFLGKMIYQIFPDRFNKSGSTDLSCKMTPFTIHNSTDDTPIYLPNEHGEITNSDFFGGNLAGITEKIPYLSSLGVGILYLNPICMAYSNHRYDTADYKRVDPMLGTDEDFKDLCDTCHNAGIKVILDGVFSHTGSDSVYFDAKHRFGNGAISAPESSPYKEWYNFKNYPDDYEAWWGVATLPCVNELNQAFMNYIIHDEDSVVAHWMRLGADGFRLDVVDEIPDEFLKALRARVKELNPDSIIIGEVWEDASNKISYSKRRTYFTASELDSTMNYPFRTAVICYAMGNSTPVEFENSVMTILENYPPDVVACLMNSLSTHDTPRILTLLSGVTYPTREERASALLSCEQRALAIAREKLAAALQFSLPGNPAIYYGDEIGMEGYEDPFNRRYFRWDLQDSDLLEFYRSASDLKKHPAMQGIKTEFAVDGALLHFIRSDGQHTLHVVANNTESSVAVPQKERIILSSGYSSDHLDPYGWYIYE